MKPRCLSSQSAVIINCPFSGGQPRKGVEHGPAALSKSDLVERLKGLGWNMEWDTSIDWAGVNAAIEGDANIGTMINPRSVSLASKELSQVVSRVAQAGKLPITVGGDHSLGLGTVVGVATAHPDAAVIWVDAHADINTPRTTPSGNLHGCPVSFALGLDGTDIEPFNEWLPKKPVASTQRLVYIGLRDVDEGERKILKDHHIKVFSMHHVDKYGIGKVRRSVWKD